MTGGQNPPTLTKGDFFWHEFPCQESTAPCFKNVDFSHFLIFTPLKPILLKIKIIKNKPDQNKAIKIEIHLFCIHVYSIHTVQCTMYM